MFGSTRPHTHRSYRRLALPNTLSCRRDPRAQIGLLRRTNPLMRGPAVAVSPIHCMFITNGRLPGRRKQNRCCLRILQRANWRRQRPGTIVPRAAQSAAALPAGFGVRFIVRSVRVKKRDQPAPEGAGCLLPLDRRGAKRASYGSSGAGSLSSASELAGSTRLRDRRAPAATIRSRSSRGWAGPSG